MYTVHYQVLYTMLIVNFATADVIDRETDTCKAGAIRRYMEI